MYRTYCSELNICQSFAADLLDISRSETLQPYVEQSIRKSASNAVDNLKLCGWTFEDNIGDNLYGNMAEKLVNKMGDNFEEKMGDAIGDKVGDEIRDRRRDEIGGKMMDEIGDKACDFSEEAVRETIAYLDSNLESESLSQDSSVIESTLPCEGAKSASVLVQTRSWNSLLSEARAFCNDSDSDVANPEYDEWGTKSPASIKFHDDVSLQVDLGREEDGQVRALPSDFVLSFHASDLEIDPELKSQNKDLERFEMILRKCTFSLDLHYSEDEVITGTISINNIFMPSDSCLETDRSAVTTPRDVEAPSPIDTSFSPPKKKKGLIRRLTQRFQRKKSSDQDLSAFEKEVEDMDKLQTDKSTQNTARAEADGEQGYISESSTSDEEDEEKADHNSSQDEDTEFGGTNTDTGMIDPPSSKRQENADNNAISISKEGHDIITEVRTDEEGRPITDADIQVDVSEDEDEDEPKYGKKSGFYGRIWKSFTSAFR